MRGKRGAANTTTRSFSLKGQRHMQDEKNLSKELKNDTENIEWE